MNDSASVALLGTGSSLPPRVVPNDWFEGFLQTSDEWIRTRTGIRERRYASDSETSASLGIEASRKALAKADLSSQDLDLIICATVTPDTMCPATANRIQAALGCRPIPSFDILAACTGFLYALSIAQQYIRSGTARTVLVVGSEVLSRTLDMNDRNTCILFGDGAGAAILGASPRPNFGVHHVKIYSDAEAAHLINVPSMVSPPINGQPMKPFMTINGREVFKFAVRKMAELMQDAILECRRLGIEVDYLIPHQVNQRIIDAALESTGFPASKVMVNLNKYGNTSAASVPIALDEAISEGRLGEGKTILLIAFGGGLTWGSTLITL